MQTFISTTSLRDGTPIRFCRIRPSDTARISYAFNRLSPRSRYLRFFAPISSLSDDQLRVLANVDFIDRVALAAELTDQPERPFAGIGRWVRSISDPHMAELAVTVVDEYQHRGLGLALLGRLAQIAAQHDVQWFVATVLAENLAVRHALNRFGATQVGYDMGAYAFRLSVSACSLRG